MKNKIKNFLNEEEIFRINQLVESFHYPEEDILESLTTDHELNSKELDRFDVSAGMMYDCWVDTRQNYLASKGKLPYQVWNSFVKRFNAWLETRILLVSLRQVITEVILENEDYKNYFTSGRKTLLKQNFEYILKRIEDRNNEINKEVSHV